MTITVSQDRYIKSIVERAGLGEANPNVIPMPAGTQHKRYTGPRIDYPYATRIGELLCAALGTFREIAYPVQHLSQFTSNPGPEHIAGIKQIYQYLHSVKDIGITYKGKGAVPDVLCYSDADWGQNILDRRSISGHAFVLAGGAVSWTSKKQPTVALSTLEGEYVALSLTIRHALWIQQFLTDLSLSPLQPIIIRSDSLSAIALTKDAQFHARSKHIDICHHFIGELLEKKMVEILFVPGEENLADALTKALPHPRHHRLRHLLKETGLGRGIPVIESISQDNGKSGVQVDQTSLAVDRRERQNSDSTDRGGVLEYNQSSCSQPTA
jgi:hypothetical protein